MAYPSLSQNFLVFVSKPAVILQSTSPLSPLLSSPHYYSVCLQPTIILAFVVFVETMSSGSWSVYKSVVSRLSRLLGAGCKLLVDSTVHPRIDLIGPDKRNHGLFVQ